MGFSKKLSPYIKYFVSTGHEKFRDGNAEYLKASPELFEKFHDSIGPVNTPGKYLIVEHYDKFKADENDPVNLSVVSDDRNKNPVSSFLSSAMGNRFEICVV